MGVLVSAAKALVAVDDGWQWRRCSVLQRALDTVELECLADGLSVVFDELLDSGMTEMDSVVREKAFETRRVEVAVMVYDVNEFSTEIPSQEAVEVLPGVFIEPGVVSQPRQLKDGRMERGDCRDG